MKFRLVLSLVLLAGASMVQARSARDLISENPLRAGGVYYAYPAPDSIDTISIPAGYEPFYVSHYGRHGSRYLISDNDYIRVMDVLAAADSAGALTPAGKHLKAAVDTIWEEARGRGGELSPLGSRQHHGIARRLGVTYPEIFADGAEVTAASTTVMRCAHSMFAFIEGLKEMYPYLQIPRESSERNMYFLNYHSPESGKLTGHNGPHYQDYKRFYAANTRPDRLVEAIFSDKTYVDRWIDRDEFMWNMYWLAVDLQNMETTVDLIPLFTEDELYDLWQTANFYFFCRNSSYAPANGMYTANARNLLRNIIDQADAYIAAGNHGATLRFGHDGNIIPLVALMRLDGCYSDTDEPARLADDYADFFVSPMASNLQLIFFRHPADAAAEPLVRICLNEKDISLPVMPVSDGIYRWSDLRDYFISLCQ